MFLSEWREFPSAPCLAGKKENLMTARVSMLLKSRSSEWREFPSAPCLAGGKKKLDDSSRLDVVEIARVLDILPSLFPSW